MDYIAWGQEYLDQANILYEKLEALKKREKYAKRRPDASLQRNIAILYSMYLECRHTGRLLQERGEKRA